MSNKYIISLKNMAENISLKHKSKISIEKIDETRSYFIKEKDQNELMRKNHKKVCTTLSYIERLLILVSTATGCVSISAFALLFGIPIGITSSAVGLKICAITAGIKKYKSIIKKKKKKHDKIALLAKTKLNTIEVVISRTLINSHISIMNLNLF